MVCLVEQGILKFGQEQWHNMVNNGMKQENKTLLKSGNAGLGFGASGKDYFW